MAWPLRLFLLAFCQYQAVDVLGLSSYSGRTHATANCVCLGCETSHIRWSCYGQVALLAFSRRLEDATSLCAGSAHRCNELWNASPSQIPRPRDDRPLRCTWTLFTLRMPKCGIRMARILDGGRRMILHDTAEPTGTRRILIQLYISLTPLRIAILPRLLKA